MTLSAIDWIIYPTLANTHVHSQKSQTIGRCLWAVPKQMSVHLNLKNRPREKVGMLSVLGRGMGELFLWPIYNVQMQANIAIDEPALPGLGRGGAENGLVKLGR